MYALDDAYIHMAVAKNLAAHGVWGVTRYEFTSSTSSLLWPLLLAAADALRVPPEVAPLALSLVSALAAVAVAAFFLRGGSGVVAGAALVAVVLATPLPTLVLAGMEHALHVAAVLGLLVLLRRGLEGTTPAWALGLAAALAASVRYESLFLLFPAAVALVLFGRRSAAVATVVGGALPPAAYAVVSIAHGWPPIPNSLLLKGAPLSLAQPGGLAELLGVRVARAFVEAPHLLVLVAAVLLTAALPQVRREDRALAFVFTAAVVTHLELAATGWLYRYEAYLVAIGVVLVARLLGAEAVPKVANTAGPGARGALVAAALVAASPLAVRAVAAWVETPRACKNVYEQQYQMGLLLQQRFAGASVMANDIGAITYLADVRLLDLYGLATRETARARRDGTLDRPLLDRLTRDFRPDVIVVYRSWFADALPPEWVEVGTWRVPEKIVVADRTVSFFSPDAAKAPRIAQALADYQDRLPATVVSRVADVSGPVGR